MLPIRQQVGLNFSTAATTSAGCAPLHRMRENSHSFHHDSWASGPLGQQGIRSPFPVSPRGTPGRGWFPPRRCTFRASQYRWHGPCCGSPRKRGCAPPLRHPPIGLSRCGASDARLERGDGARGKRIKDGRHFGLDFYDLLIETLTCDIVALFRYKRSTGSRGSRASTGGRLAPMVSAAPGDGSHTPWGKAAMDVVKRWYLTGGR